jgi:alkyl sulfatase BDS1-like metallo-beta-lactamase superfamily hydrolase
MAENVIASLHNIYTLRGAPVKAQIADGTAKVDGDVGVLSKLAATMVDFDPRFEIMPGTKARTSKVAHADPYQAVPEKIIAE